MIKYELWPIGALATYAPIYSLSGIASKVFFVVNFIFLCRVIVIFMKSWFGRDTRALEYYMLYTVMLIIYAFIMQSEY